MVIGPDAAPFSTDSGVIDTATERGFQVWDAAKAQQAAQWIRLWEAWPVQDVHYHPNFVRLFCGPGSRPVCATWDDSDGKVMFPFVLRDLGTEPYWEPDLGKACDLVTPYGYGGAVFWACAEVCNLARRFWNAFNAWASAQPVVTQFVRFSLFDQDLLPYPGMVNENRKVIVRNLRVSSSAILRECSHNVRYNIKRAIRSGLKVKVDCRGDTLPEFLRIYEHTMRRRNASAMYLFPQEFFHRLHEGLSGKFAYFHAVDNGRVVSSELLLLSATVVYSFLGGTDSEAFKTGANHLLNSRPCAGPRPKPNAGLCWAAVTSPTTASSTTRKLRPQGHRALPHRAACVRRRCVPEALGSKPVRPTYRRGMESPAEYFPPYRA